MPSAGNWCAWECCLLYFEVVYRWIKGTISRTSFRRFIHIISIVPSAGGSLSVCVCVYLPYLVILICAYFANKILASKYCFCFEQAFLEMSLVFGLNIIFLFLLLPLFSLFSHPLSSPSFSFPIFSLLPLSLSPPSHSKQLTARCREKDGDLYCLRCFDNMESSICGACR